MTFPTHLPPKPRLPDIAGPSEIEISRRSAAAGLFSALGLVALTSCVDDGNDPAQPLVATTSADLTGTTFSWVDTRANLRAMTPPTGTTSKAVVLEGCLSAGDGGGGLFFWSSADMTADDGGTVLSPGGGAGRWRRVFSGPFNAKWFGAGLGATDDRPTIQAVIDLVGARGGGIVYLPAGTYKISSPLTINAAGVSVLGDGKDATKIVKAGIDSTIFSLNAAHYCQIADLSLGMQGGSPSTGSAILFNSGQTNVTIQRVYIGTMWQGITCGGALSENNLARETVIRDVKMENTLHVGLKMCFALNWTVASCVIGMHFDDAWNAPGTNHFGVWLDTDAEGCIFDTIFVLGGEHCWRIANSINPAVRGPNEHRFYSCIGDNGTVSEIYISSLHRSLFEHCWVSGQHTTSDAAIVMDSSDIWGVQWTRSQVVNVNGHGIKVLAATSFSITDSTFSEWNLSTSPAHSAVIVYPGVGRCNFTVTGNQFIRDVDFGAHTNLSTVSVTSGTYNRYIISNNLSYGGTSAANLGAGGLSAVSDLGTASWGKFVNNNL